VDEQEKQFIYSQLNGLKEQVIFLTEKLNESNENMVTLVGILRNMQTPGYMRGQAKVAETMEVAEKLAMIRNMVNRGNKGE